MDGHWYPLSHYRNWKFREYFSRVFSVLFQYIFFCHLLQFSKFADDIRWWIWRNHLCKKFSATSKVPSTLTLDFFHLTDNNCPLSQCLNVILSLLVGRFRYMLLVLGDENSSVTKLGGTSVQVKIHHCLFQHLLWIEYLRVEIGLFSVTSVVESSAVRSKV